MTSSLIATTVRGLEDAAALDIRETFGVAAEPLRHGAVRIPCASESRDPLVVLLNRHARSLHRVGLPLAEGEARSLADCEAIARSVDWRPFLEPGQSFGVRPLRAGRHDFGSPDIGRVVGAAVLEGYKEMTGHRLPVDLDHPDVIVRSELVEEAFRIWIDTTGDVSLHRRGYRVELHPAPLNPTIAWLLLRLAGWRGESLIDPMCGIGTIPIEAALAALRIPPARTRPHPFAWESQTWLDPAARELRSVPLEAALERIGIPAPEGLPTGASALLGAERSPAHVAGARVNARAAGVSEAVRFVEGDATNLEDLFHRETIPTPALVVSNPPYGRRIGSLRRVERLYRDFAASAASAGIGRVAVLSERVGPMTRALEDAGYRIAHVRKIRYGDLDVRVFVAHYSVAESIVAMPRKLKKPTTSVTVVRKIDED